MKISVILLELYLYLVQVKSKCISKHFVDRILKVVIHRIFSTKSPLCCYLYMTVSFLTIFLIESDII